MYWIWSKINADSLQFQIGEGSFEFKANRSPHNFYQILEGIKLTKQNT